MAVTSRQSILLRILHNDRRREVYEAASGGYFVTYNPGASLEPFTKQEIDDLVAKRFLQKKYPDLEIYRLAQSKNGGK